MSASDSLDARGRLLQAATEVFAARGFKDSTVRMICEQAGVNLAAINYYFGDKERLYVEAIQHAHRVRSEEFPLPDWPAQAPPELKLRGFIHTLLDRMLAEVDNAAHLHLMLREMHQPTSACGELVREYIRPHFEVLVGLLRQLSPPGTDDETLHLSAFSVVGQCLYHRLARPVIRALVGPEEHARYDADRLTEHIWRGTLAAVGHVAHGAE